MVTVKEDPELEQEGIRQNNLIYSGLIGIGVVMVQPFLTAASLDLSAKEFELLAYLAERPGKMIGKRELLAAVWRQPYGGADKTVDVHLSWLRKKLGETAAEPRYIHTRRGVGVKLVDPDS